MKRINKQKVKIKNLLGIVDKPTEEDLLFEIVDFLESESRLDGVFKKSECSLKTRCRINQELVDDLTVLCNIGYLEKDRYGRFVVLKHPWEDEN